MKGHNFINLGLLSISIIVFVLFCEKYISYTIDDSFIFYRYSENVAEGFLFSWNYNDVKEFGFTSYLYTIVVALGIKLGYDPIIFSKAVTIFSGISVMFMVGFSLKIFTDNKFKLYFLASLPLAFTPIFAFHSVIGMETVFFGALLLASIISYAYFVKKNEKRWLFLAVVFTIFATFTRYESILVSISFFVYILYQKIFLNEGTKITSILINFAPIVFLIGLLVWNLNYFGQPLPNPFYVKESRDFTDVMRSIYEITSFLTFASPFLLLTILKLKTHLKNKFTSFLIIQTIVSLFPFIFITQWINPFYRYYVHEFPVLIILGFFSLYLLKDKFEVGKYSKFTFVAVILFLMLFNLPTNAAVTQMVESQTNTLENTHYKIGKTLGNYPELKHNTIATIVDAGAIPYFSKWQTYDYTLNDKVSVQNGFSVERFYETNPKFMFFYDSSAGKSFKTLFGYFEKDSLETFRDYFIKKMLDETSAPYQIVNHEKFDDYELVTLYPRTYVFAEKEFVEKNQQLINELIERSVLEN